MEKILAVIIVTTCWSVSHSLPSSPNFILMVADDLGMGDVGFLGNDTIRTPNIDSIAERGALLTQHLAAASVCTPSRTALMTGRYPIRAGMVPTHIIRVNIFTSSVSGLPNNETTVADMLKQKDYSTGYIGKWHLGLSCETYTDFCSHPLKLGFDYFYGLPLTNLKDFGDDGDSVVYTRVPYLDEIVVAIVIGAAFLLVFLVQRELLGKGPAILILTILVILAAITLFICKNMKLLNSLLMRNYEVVEQPMDLYDNLTQKLVTEGVEFMESQVAAAKPFFLVISWLQVHTALYTSKEFEGVSKHGKYGDNVEEMDWSVGEVLKAVERLGITDNTFVYFTSDNGAHIDEYGIDGERHGGYNGIYKGGKTMGGMEGGVRVPTAVMWPGVIPAGLKVDQPTSNMDILPTLAYLSGANVPERPLDGYNMMPLLTNATDHTSHKVIMHYCGADIHAARYSPQDSLDVWKVMFVTPDFIPGTSSCGYICDCNSVIHHDPPLLYNIAIDPSEENPLDSTAPEYQEIMQTVFDAVGEHVASIEPVENQFDLMKMLPRPWLQPCCNPPSCHCEDDKFKP